jgi:hypothetical protein
MTPDVAAVPSVPEVAMPPVVPLEPVPAPPMPEDMFNNLVQPAAPFMPAAPPAGVAETMSSGDDSVISTILGGAVVWAVVVLTAYNFMSEKPRESSTRPSNASAASARPNGRRSAPTIFFEGLENLGKDPLGWLDLAKPTPLRSNMPPEPLPTAAAKGVVVPTATSDVGVADKL